MRKQSEAIGKYIESLKNPVNLSTASQEVGLSTHPRAAGQQISAAFNDYKNKGDDFMCGQISGKITGDKGEYLYK